MTHTFYFFIHFEEEGYLVIYKPYYNTVFRLAPACYQDGVALFVADPPCVTPPHPIYLVGFFLHMTRRI